MAAFIPLAILVSLLAAAATADDYSHNPSPPQAPYAPPPATPAPHSDKLLVRVEGLVYCQSCAHQNLWSLDDAEPLPKAKMMVTCRDTKNRVMAWRNPVADDNGHFLAEFGVTSAADYYMGDPIKACFVRLLVSPVCKCNDLTNINYGIQGTLLRDEGKRWPGEGCNNVVYAAGPLAFKPTSCVPTHHY